MEETLADLAQHPDSWDPGRHAGRCSLAGAQSHLNEHLCLRAAQLCGLPAAATELLASDKYEVLISHRYDRHQDPDGRWRRLHQEDFCQALSISPSKKYQSDGGPGFDQLGDLLSRRSLGSHRRGNLQTMFDYLVFNVAIAATDAHAKNFSLLLSSRSVRLAPLYDVGDGQRLRAGLDRRREAAGPDQRRVRQPDEIGSFAGSSGLPPSSSRGRRTGSAQKPSRLDRGPGHGAGRRPSRSLGTVGRRCA